MIKLGMKLSRPSRPALVFLCGVLSLTLSSCASPKLDAAPRPGQESAFKRQLEKDPDFQRLLDEIGK
jgi:hypothetical protein